MNYIFVKYYSNNYAGESKPYYKTIATATDKDIARMINNSVPNRSDKNDIVCVIFDINGYEQYHDFDYDFTHVFDNTIQVY